ncbi:hydroxysteroid dehydrogenase-like protein 1 [Trichonephila clavipes]|nr:hydroxysteroid dehydrogenase-like protein 1 [Trichonephila clavipes]
MHLALHSKQIFVTLDDMEIFAHQITLGKPTIYLGHLRNASANLDLVLPVHKNNSLLAELRSAALATIHEIYPDQDWLHVFTDGSATASFGRAGADVFSNSFNLKEPLSAWSDNFDGREVVLQWIPSHCGIYGNVQANKLAKEAASTLPSDASLKRQATSQGQIATEENLHSFRPSCWQILVLSARWPKMCSAFCPT